MSNPSIKNKRIRKDDKVLVISGNYKGQTGTVLSRVGEKVLIQGINVRKKHVKRSEAHPNGGVIEIEGPINVSNVALCNADGKPVKLRSRTTENGVRELYYQEDGRDVVYRTLKKI